MATVNGYFTLRAISTADDTDLAAATYKWSSSGASAVDIRTQLEADKDHSGGGIITFKGTDAANETFAWTLYAFKGEDAPAEHVATGTGILGLAETGNTNEYFADTIAITSDTWINGITVYDSGNDRVAKLQFDTCEYRHWLCIMTKTTCASMGADMTVYV